MAMVPLWRDVSMAWPVADVARDKQRITLTRKSMQHSGKPKKTVFAVLSGIVQRGTGRLSTMLAALGVGMTVAAVQLPAASAQPVPAQWIAYAQMAGTQFEAWLSDPANDTAARLHAWMQERSLQGGQPAPPPLIVRVWVAPSGQVQRVEFASMGQAQADADLRALMTTRALPAAPPPDMRQPMMLELTLHRSEAH